MANTWKHQICVKVHKLFVIVCEELYKSGETIVHNSYKELEVEMEQEAVEDIFKKLKYIFTTKLVLVASNLDKKTKS